MFSKQLNGKCQLASEETMSKKSFRMRDLWLLLAAVIVLCTNVTITQASSPIGKVEFGDCIQDEDGLECEAKMAVTVPVSFGLSQTMDFVEVLPESEETIRVEITKSVPTERYTLRYLHTVAYYPYEKVTRTPHPISGCGDIDCDDPNGFSIVRSLVELEGLFGNCLFRGEELLGGPATLEEPYCTKHSLETGQVYFDGYEINEAVRFYEITTVMKKGGDQVDFKLSPNDPYYVELEGDFKIKAEIVGDMDKFQGSAELDNYILYIPSGPAGHPMVDDYQNNMLLVPREEVTKDGSEIDKVGISTYAFKKLKSDYSISVAGDGLGNQLFHKHNSDLQKLVLNPNAEMTYLVHGKRDFKGSMSFVSGMDKVLICEIPEINNTLVSLTMDEKDVKVINTQSIGVVNEAYVQTFNSMTGEGTLVVEIENFGSFPTDYIVTVTEATMHIVGETLPAQARSLVPQNQTELKFDVNMDNNLESTHEFLVTLKSPTGMVYDSVWVIFDTDKYDSKSPDELYEQNNATEVVLPDDLNAPVITLNGTNPVTLTCGVDTYVEEGATAVDDVDGTVPVTIGGDTVDTLVNGTYIVTYTAKDSACNAAQESRTVEVVGTCPTPLVGDNDFDGDVDIVDFGRLAENWLVGTTL